MIKLQQQSNKQLQILAPAGSCEHLIAAVNNGCDAVYLGLDSFNARMKAPNFTLDNLSQWVDYCHLFGVKVFVAINTSIKNDEFCRAVELLKNVYRKNVDGVIVTDLALLRIAGSFPKPFEVVASTQLNIHDSFGAEFVKNCGATTVVCSRECSLEQIREIASTGIKVECFLHGAMCVCQSGQCLFSSVVGGNSGNRGLCAQPCRKYYTVDGAGGRGGYLLSARDICSLDTAAELAHAGATTFKIEGRNRRPEYAGITSRIYRKLFDQDFVAENNDQAALAEMYNRGMSANHYLSGSNADIIYPQTQNHIGVEAGIVGRGGVSSCIKLHKGDGLKVFDGGKEVCGGVVLENGIGLVRAQFSGKVIDGMLVRRTTSVKLCDSVMSAKRKLDVEMLFAALVGQRPLLIAKCNGVQVGIEGDWIAEKACKSPTNADEITKQLQKSGDTYYTICDIVTETDDVFLAKSQINSLRREVLNELTKKIISYYNRQFDNRLDIDCALPSLNGDKLNSQNDYIDNCCAVVCYNEEQLQFASKYSNYLIYKPSVIDVKSFETAALYHAFVDLPSFADLKHIEGLLRIVVVGLLCNNVGHVQLARKYGVDYIVGRGLNIFNDYILSEFSDAKTFVYSYELTLNEISLFRNMAGLIFVDGEIPLMQLTHCPFKVALKCDCSNCRANNDLVYRDDRNNSFKLRRRQAGRCLFELINGSKLSVVSKLKNRGNYMFDYNKLVLEHYLKINNGESDNYEELEPYTKGRLYDKIN